MSRTPATDSAHAPSHGVTYVRRSNARRATLALIVALASVVGVGALPAAAARAPLAVAVVVEMSLEEAADRVRGAYGGQVVAASPARMGGREGYRVRVMLDDGRVITVFVDGDSGAMRQIG